MSIGRLFALCMVGAGLIVLFVAGRAVVRDVSDYRAHDRSISAGLALDASLRAMESLSIERGPSFVLLNAPGAIDHRALDAARATAAGALDDLNRRLAQLTDSDDTPAIEKVALLRGVRDEIVTAWQASHHLVDEGITAPLSTPYQARAYAKAEVAVQRRFVPLLNGLQARMASGAVDSAAVIQIARYAADLREIAGLQATLITPALAERRAFNAQELHAAERLQGEIDRLDAQIEAAIDYVGNPPALVDAWHLAQAGYFTRGRALIDQILASGALDGHFPMTLPEFVRQFTPELPTLVGLRNAAAAAAISEATRSRDLSWNRVATSSAVLVLMLAAIGGLTVYFSRRVVAPLIEMTAKVGQLASGNRTVEFAGADRKDEVGGLARAMGMFRDALAANEKLQEQLLQSKKRLTMITDSLAEGVLAVDRASLVAFANPAAKRLLECSTMGRVEGRPIDTVFRLGTDGNGNGSGAWHDIIADDVPIDGHDGVLITLLGQKRPIAYTCVPLTDSDSQLAMVISFHDLQA